MASLPSRRALWGRWYVEAALYSSLSVWATWPTAAEMSTSIPQSIEIVGVVPAYSLWILWWHGDRLAEFGADYWQAPTFHPHEDVLAFSEPMFLQGWAAAPWFWLLSPSIAYGLVVLATVALNGWSTCRFLRAARIGWFAALAGGAMASMVPLVHQQLGVLPLTPLFPIAWTAHAALRFGRRPTLARGAVLGLAFGAAYLASNQLALFAGIAFAASGAWLLTSKLRRRRTWLGLLAAAATSATLLAPVAMVQLSAKQDQGFARDSQVMHDLSARPARYLYATWPQLVTVPPSKDAEYPRRHSYWPGSIKVLLALAAVGAMFLRNRRPKLVNFAATFVTVSAVLSMGMLLRVGDWHWYETFARIVPGLSQVRSVWRFAFLAQLGTCWLAAVGLEVLFGRVGEHWSRLAAPNARSRWARERHLRASLLGLALVVSTFEIRPGPVPQYRLPDPSLDREWASWVRDHTPPDAVLACFPFARGPDIDDFEPTAKWMLTQPVHRRRMVDGYSSYFPTRYRALQHSIRSFPRGASLDGLARHGVTHLVVRNSEPAAAELRGIERVTERFKSDRVSVYELLR